MNDRSSSVRSKIAQLRSTFIAQLPGRLAGARAKLAALQADPGNREAAAELHLVMHSIKGTGNTFGLKDLGVLAAEGEQLIVKLLETQLKATPEFWLEMEECIDNMALGVELLQDFAAAPSHGYQKPEAYEDAYSEENKIVYICDDEALQAEYLGEQLRCFGYRAECFTDLASFRQAVLQKPPAVAVMDIMFPENDSAGTHVLIELKKNHGVEFPVVFVSARGDFAARLNAIRAGGEAYFLKPVRAMDLVVAIDMLTRQHIPEPLRVMVVDDEPELAQYHSLILADAGMSTRVESEAENVLAAVEEFRPDLVLMDVYMPKCTGREVAKLIRQIPDFISLPIVYLSGETDSKKQSNAMGVGAEGFLTKPILPGDLVKEVALRAERMRTLRSLMARDSLTGLFNHSTTTQLLENAVTAAQRQQHPLCFAMIDVDRFKEINDTQGHPAGDQVLLALARLLQQRLRNTDLVGRYGGEEFAVILNEAPLDKAVFIMDELRGAFADLEFSGSSGVFSCTFSCGVAAYPPFASMEALREAADKALYRAKHQGRNLVVPMLE